MTTPKEVLLLEEITELLKKYKIIDGKVVTRITVSYSKELTKDFDIILTILARNQRDDDLT